MKGRSDQPVSVPVGRGYPHPHHRQGSRGVFLRIAKRIFHDNRFKVKVLSNELEALTCQPSFAYGLDGEPSVRNGWPASAIAGINNNGNLFPQWEPAGCQIFFEVKRFDHFDDIPWQSQLAGLVQDQQTCPRFRFLKFMQYMNTI